MSNSPGQPSPDIQGGHNGHVTQDTSNKRKTSHSSTSRDEPANSPKRIRRDDERRPPAHSPPAARRQSPERHPNTSQEEKNRGRRLFGGLLSTLSQKPGATQQKRRQEIEKRQQARAQEEQVNHDKQREENLARLTHERQIRQVKLDERTMEARHADMLANAHFLQTKSHPSVHYLPWELTAKQKDAIEDQIRSTQTTTDIEASKFRDEKEHRMRALGLVKAKSHTKADATTTASETKPELLVPIETSNMSGKGVMDDSPKSDANHDKKDCPAGPAANGPSPRADPMAKDADEAGDVVVEEHEDTVIY